jgi:RNA polymerase sigma-70 factor (ECF subfamily)
MSTQENAAGIEHIDGLYGYALVITQNRTNAEDLVQETYGRAIPAMGPLRNDSNVKCRLFTILRNIWLNESRQWRKATKIVDVGADSRKSNVADKNVPNPHDAHVSGIERDQVRKAIQELPDEAREIILLREYEEMSYQDIATVLGCPVCAVMSRLARARKKLRDLLSPVLQSNYSGVAGSETTE